MPKFRVTKGQDAWLVYETTVEAKDKHEAQMIADSRRYDGIWVQTGDIRQFDHTEIFDDEIYREEDCDPLEEMTLLAVTSAERDTILAALRVYQEAGMGDPSNRSDMIHEIATNGDTSISLDDEAIDELCERINQ